MKKLLMVVAILFIALHIEADMMQKPMKHKMFQSVPIEKATILQEGEAKMFCPECGMTLPMFYKTNHVGELDGKVKQYCSIHCLVEDKEVGHNDVKNIKVVAVDTLAFIPVAKATYVVGSDVKGTMSMTSKYAFSSKKAAEVFAKEHGGKVMDFAGAYAEAKKDFEKDSAMISKKQAMMAKKGEMIYAKMCQPTSKKFNSAAEAKAFVLHNGLCKGLNGKQLQAVGLFLSRR